MSGLIKKITEWKGKVPLSDYQLYHLLLAQKTRSQKQIQGFTFELTPLCTLNCKMCYVHKSKEEYERSTRIVSTKRWLEISQDAVRCGAINATLTGGEAMLHPDFVEIYKAIYNMGTLITVMSNATVITDEILSTFREYPPSFVCITLYGFSEETYLKTCGTKSFQTVIRNVLKLRDMGIAVNLQATVTKDMEHDLEAIAAFARKNDLPFAFNTVLKAAREYNAENISEIAVGNKTHPSSRCEETDTESEIAGYGLNCGAGSNHFHVTWDGYMQPCATFDMIREDILDSDCAVSHAWKRLVEKVDRIPKLAKCQECVYKENCETCPVTHFGDMHEFGKISPRLCYKIQHGIE